MGPQDQHAKQVKQSQFARNQQEETESSHNSSRRQTNDLRCLYQNDLEGLGLSGIESSIEQSSISNKSKAPSKQSSSFKTDSDAEEDQVDSPAPQEESGTDNSSPPTSKEINPVPTAPIDKPDRATSKRLPEELQDKLRLNLDALQPEEVSESENSLSY